MTISDYISKLQKIRSEVGDVEVVRPGMGATLGAVDPARGPRVASMLVLSGRQHVAKTWDALFDKEDKKGDTVVVLD